MPSVTHYKGRYLSLVERDGWEFAARPVATVAVLVAWLDDGRLLLVEQYREPVESHVIELPAGLVGDLADTDGESVIDAGGRELVEETGYRAGRVYEIARCPTSAGMTNETAVFLSANQLEKVGEGGGDESEDIVVHAVERDRLDDWLRERYTEGKAIDPKIYTVMSWGPNPRPFAAEPGTARTQETSE